MHEIWGVQGAEPPDAAEILKFQLHFGKFK